MIEVIRNNISKIFIASALIVIGVIGRLAFLEFLPSSPSLYITLNNVTQPVLMMDLFFLVAIICILSGLLFKSYFVFLVPLSIMIITDIIIGNDFIFLFTWSGFAMIGFISLVLNSKNKFTIKNTPLIFGASIGSVLLYDLWTNLGCWLGWYPNTIEGLSLCFTNALPFTLWHLLSTTVALTVIVLPILYIKKHLDTKSDYSTKPIEKPLSFY
ncbi:MAG: hypothetical protein JXA91_01760 [Candidatus Thermoplasmatota archaeon]|nr:hypothetical protein [Candidatus Thermoplasmatota archaeon]